MRAIVDFETRSVIDLKKRGVYAYALDPSTRILMMSWSVVDDENPTDKRVNLWLPDTPFPRELREVIDGGGFLVAHNAAFERLVWQHVGPRYKLPPVPLEQWVCTAAQASVNGLPRALENLSRCLMLPDTKDMAGHAVMLKWCKPLGFENGAPLWATDPTEFEKLKAYCVKDTLVERIAHLMMRPMTIGELAEYHESERINDRGVCVDLEFANVAVAQAATEKAELGAELYDLTGIDSGRKFAAIKKWLEPRLPEEAKKMMLRWKAGVQKTTFDKSVRAQMLDAIESNEFAVLPEVRRAIELIDDSGSTSVSKYRTALDRTVNGRLRGVYVYAGAGQTHRFSSTGIQLHNLRRDAYAEDQAEALMDALITGGALPKNHPDRMTDTLAKLIRPTLVAPEGKKFVWGDWAAIEARVLPWLSNSPLAAPLLDTFRQGGDVYLRTAADIYGGYEANITKPQRQVGKVAVLALGFGGGVGAFNAMARGYGVRVSDPEAERIRDRWREANPWAREFWNAIDGAVAMSMKHPVTPFSAGRLMYVYRPDFFEGMGALFCLLPSARLLCYPMPRYDVVKRKFPDGSTKEQRVLTAVKGSRKPGQTESEWPRSNLWFGLLAENATQAVAGQVLRDTLMRVRDLPYYLDVVAHTHDEVVTEVDEDDDKAEADLLHAMTTVEGWAEGLPLAAEISSGVRYGK